MQDIHSIEDSYYLRVMVTVEKFMKKDFKLYVSSKCYIQIPHKP